MKALPLFFFSILFFGIPTLSHAQSVPGKYVKASLQASGLTCSMCSKAVKEALEEVPFVEKVQVDIKKQQYNMSFKEGSAVDFDALAKAVEDAGFGVASLKLAVSLDPVVVKKDQHIQIGGHLFHFLNAKGQTLSGTATVTLVDKAFVSAREFKKYSAASSMECVQTGRMAACCASPAAENTRVYHVII